MTTIPDIAERRILQPVRWIIGPFVDSTFLIGSVLASVALLGLWYVDLINTLQLLAIWVFVFHGPHFFATLTRTVFDKTEWKRRKGLFLGSLLFFAVGPGLVVLSKITTGKWFGGQFVQLFFFGAAIWAYHHVCKQHFGFVALYRAKAGERDRRELQWIRYWFLTSLWIPAIILLTNAPGWLLGIPWIRPLADTFGSQRILELTHLVRIWGIWLFVALQGAYLLHLVQRVRQGRGINIPENLTIGAALGLHWLIVIALLHMPASKMGAAGVASADPIAHYAFVPLVVIFHNIQYLALVHTYNRDKYLVPGGRQKFGPATFLSRNFVTLWIFGLLFTLVTIGPEQFRGLYLVLGFEYDHGSPPELFEMWNPATPTGIWLATAVWGWSFWHYHVDSKIWKVNHDPEIQKVLGL